MSLAAPLLARDAGTEARRALAFRSARRHSARVRVLRIGMAGGAAGLVAAIVLVTAFDPFGSVLHGVSVQGAAMEGTKVTMSTPRLSGFQKDGRPYEIEADRAVQDIKTPTYFDLYGLKARLTMEDRTSTRLSAASGSYNSTTEIMTLGGGARVTGDNGLDVQAADATVQFKTSTLFTDKPVNVAMPGKRITADSMRITEGGKRVAFDGHVHTEIEPEGVPAPAGGTTLP